jgi:hypothetical protein
MRKNQHGPISTIYMMTVGQMKIWHMAIGIHFYENYFFIGILISTIHCDYHFRFIYIVTHGTIKSGHIAYWLNFGKKITYIGGWVGKTMCIKKYLFKLLTYPPSYLSRKVGI